MTAGTHGSTYGGNPLACAVGCAVMDIVTDPAFLAEVNRKAGLMRQKLEGLVAAPVTLCVECHDDVGGGLQTSAAGFDAIGGETYQIAVGGVETVSGRLWPWRTGVNVGHARAGAPDQVAMDDQQPYGRPFVITMPSHCKSHG